MPWNACKIYPVDEDWHFVLTVDETRRRIAALREGKHWECHPLASVEEFDRDFQNACVLARSVGWEGIFQGPPCVFWIPGDGRMEYGFVWKQESNGDCFVVSPRPLDYLTEFGASR